MNNTAIMLSISDRITISDLQNQFTSYYPYLRMEFFSQEHSQGEPTHRKLMKSANKTLGECRTVHKAGTVEIRPEMTVAELEQKFKEQFGLNMQLFRKSGKVWLETTITDNWTLNAQNSQGEALSHALG
jgi:hypothetical protein